MHLPPDGLHPWDGQDEDHRDRINLLEGLMRQEVDGLGGIQNILNMLNAARQRLSDLVNPGNPAMAHVDPAVRLALVLGECASVSVVQDDIIPGPGNARVHHFKFCLSGQLEPLRELMRLLRAREQATSGRHTTRGIDFNAIIPPVHAPGQGPPAGGLQNTQWKYVYFYLLSYRQCE